VNTAAVFFGAGSAAIGVTEQIAQYFIRTGLSDDEARFRFWLVELKGLVTSDRGNKLAENETYFSRRDNTGVQYPSLEGTMDHVRPTMLIGLSGVRGAFSQRILRKMAKWNKLPIIFPLSNPLTHSECTFNESVAATEGRLLFASGSPFSYVPFKGGDYHPAQGNNMYVTSCLLFKGSCASC
jgi:malate dehydrogenase (oxaloacetate-decarboxylating)(NADP+)